MLSNALAAGLLLTLGQLPWEVGLRTEGRASEGARDLELNPHLALGYEHRDLLVHLRYDPRFLLKGPSSRGVFDQVQAGSASGAMRFDPDTRLLGIQEVSVGSVDLSWTSSSLEAAPSSIARDAGSSSVLMLDESTSLSLVHAVSRRIHVAGTARYSVTGGLGDGLATVPRTQTAALGASAAWIERRDGFSLALASSRGWVSTSATTWLLGASGAWRHALSHGSELALEGEQPQRLGQREEPRYETELSAGVATTGESTVEGYRLDPTASFALRRDEPAPRAGALSGRVVLRYAPTLDLATGELTPRYELSAMADLRLHRWVVAFGGGGAAFTREPTPPLPEVTAQGGIGLAYEPVAGVTISASGRVARLSEVEWSGVVATTITQMGRF